jgi:hypothetical protein
MPINSRLDFTKEAKVAGVLIGAQAARGSLFQVLLPRDRHRVPSEHRLVALVTEARSYRTSVTDL